MRLERRRLYILPTRAGLAFAGLLLCMLVAGLNYANSAALFLTFLLGGFAIVAMHRCHRNLLGVTVTAARAWPAFAGDSVRTSVMLANASELQRADIELRVPGYPRDRADLDPGGGVMLELRVPSARRGLMRIERLELATTFPFGLFRTWTWLHAPIDAVVYPRPQGTRPPPGTPQSRAGLRASAGMGDDEWLGLRNFRDGDSPRRVAWKALARGDALLVKEYGAASDDLRLFDIAELRDLPLESRLEQLARWIVDAEARGDRYAVRLTTTHLAPDRGPEHRHRCLAALALYDG